MTTLEHLRAAEKARAHRQKKEAEYWRKYWLQKLQQAQKAGAKQKEAGCKGI